MRLSKIELKNFRLFSNTSLRLDKTQATTILVGANNSGKTSITRALALFLDGSVKNFSISDFSITTHHAFSKAQDQFLAAHAAPAPAADDSEAPTIPKMSMTLEFEYADTPADLAVAADLLMDLDAQAYKIAICLEMEVKDIDQLAADYVQKRDQDESLLSFVGRQLSDYYSFTYYKKALNGPEREHLSEKSVIAKLIKVDFVGAQRHIDDEDSSKATLLSNLLHSHYEKRYKVDEPDSYKELEQMLRVQSSDLSGKYEAAFSSLITSIKAFGHPKTPQFTVKAELSASTLFKDNTRIFYEATLEATAPEQKSAIYGLPEQYNGLGFKNLIYIILQVKSFRENIRLSEAFQPRVHIIVIEEPEAHLHPQVQSLFIGKIDNLLDAENSESAAQVLLTTHSSHIVAHCGFAPIRYFRRKGLTVDVKDLLTFQDTQNSDEEKAALDFLRRYLTLTRCDLFFSDKAILIEGAVERLLLPKMMQLCAAKGFENLTTDYISVVEVGGAYAHIFKALVKFIEVPTLIITDLDSIGADNKKCPVAVGVSSSNATLKSWLPGKSVLSELMKATPAEKMDGLVRVAYQVSESKDMPCARSFEESFIYKNGNWLFDNKGKLLGTGKHFSAATAEAINAEAFDLDLPKVDFAIDLMVVEGWEPPLYIAEGLAWLAECPA